MINIRIFIVEDDPVYAVDLERMIEECGYRLIGSAGRAEPLLDKLVQDGMSIDLILMDINIKGSMNGIELAKTIRAYSIPVIFLTAYDDPQVYQSAQEASPFGYLVKPIKKHTLQNAIDSALLHSSDPHLTTEVFRLWQENELFNDMLFVKGVDKLIKLFISDIGLVEAEGNYIIIHARQNRVAVKMPLKQIRQRLSMRRFVQIHRKYLVQLTHIESINPSNNEVEVGGKRIPIGANYKSQLLGRLNKL